MDKVKISFSLNIVITILVLFSTVCMIFGIKFMNSFDPFSSLGIDALKYYTVDSNLFVGIVSFILSIFEYKLMKGKIECIPSYIYKLKYVSTVCVILTFVVTTFYLAPSSSFGFFAFFQNSNLFFHLIIPIISLVSFVFFERCKINFINTFYGLLPSFIYGILYGYNVLTHIEGGKASPLYDWYGFLAGGVDTLVIVILIMLLINYLICFIIWKLNKKLCN